MTVVTVTVNPCIDKTFSVPRLVTERKLSASDVRCYPGGGGINVARVIQRLGGNVKALWSCGGATGPILAGLLEAEALSHVPVPIRGAVRENVIVRDRSTDQQYRFGMPGPEISAAERRAFCVLLAEHAASARYAVLSGSLPAGAPPAWYAELVRCLPSSVRIVLDTKHEALASALDAGAYLIKPNVHELEELVGRELGDDTRIEAAARSLIDRRAAEVVLVSLGRGGALLVTADGAERLTAPAVPMRSKVGAGDSMVGGVVAALSRGRSLSEAARVGVAAGAAAVITEGTELARREDIERLLDCLRLGKERS